MNTDTFDIPFDFDTDHTFGVVALLGAPNVGKSTLLNHILGQKIAIVTPKPQTTRNRISGILTEDDAQIMFLDTPGLHRLRGRMNSFLLRSAKSAAASADVVLAMVDAACFTSSSGAFDKETGPLFDYLQTSDQPVLFAVNKVDLVKDKSLLLPLMEQLANASPDVEIHPISALSGQGVPELKEAVKARLPKGPPMFPEDLASTVPMRFMAAETIREKLFLRLKQEVPYNTAVEIESWEEPKGKGSIKIGAVIYVSKPTHKSIVIGKAGSTLKEIGTQARVELEEMLDNKVFLRLFVKVKEAWTENPNFLSALGLGE